jgi:hypothetical protein
MKILILALALALCGCAEKRNIACTMEAKACPDGSYVGRDPDKNCEFRPCPAR